MPETDIDWIAMKQIRGLCPSRPNKATISAWINKGLLVKQRDGKRIRVKLRVRRFGNRVYTTKTWLQAFFDRTDQ